MSVAGPLKGVVVVEIGSNIAGPATTQLLAQQGAQVIKVELPSGDPSRQYFSPSEFGTLNAGKQGFVWSEPEAYQKILSIADVIVDNRTIDAKERDLILQSILNHPKKKRPLVFCSITGYPAHYGNRVALDQSVQAETGMAAVNGVGGSPRRVGFVVLDLATPLRAAFDIVSTLFALKNGFEVPNAQNLVKIEVSMAQVASYLLFGHYLKTLEGKSAETVENRRIWVAPFGFYSARDGLISIAITQDDQFKRFAEGVLERPDLAVSYPRNQDRVRAIDALEKILNKVLAERDRQDWVLLCQKHRIACSPVNSLQEAVEQPYVREFLTTTAEGLQTIDTRSFSNVFPREPLGEVPQLTVLAGSPESGPPKFSI